MKRGATVVMAAAAFAAVAPNALADDGLLSGATSTLSGTTQTLTQTTAPLTTSATQTTTPVTQTLTQNVTQTTQTVTQTTQNLTQTVTQTSQNLTQTVTQTTEPVVQTTTDVVTTVTDTVAPVVDSTTSLTESVTDTVTPVIDTVTKSVAPVTGTVEPIAQPVTKTVTPVTAPVQSAPVLDRTRPDVAAGGAVAAADPASIDDDTVSARRGAKAGSGSSAIRVSSTSIVVRVPGDGHLGTAAPSGGFSQAQATTGTAAATAIAPTSESPTRSKPEGSVEPAPRGLLDKIRFPQGAWNASGPFFDGMLLVFAVLLGIWSLTVPPFARRLLRLGGSAWLAVVIAVIVPPG